ncbi:MAG: flagellar motor switch protein FliG [Hyphomicrobiaceae bacterium]|nr:flagellar motor switch protein FliG [Hyphomicrobiaceae bacterium]
MSLDTSDESTVGRMELAGAQKVTALLLSMSKPLADRIVRNFDDREIRILARTASELPMVLPEVIEALIGELEAGLQTGQRLQGSTTGAQQLLAGVVSDDQVSEILAEIEGTAHDRVWARLEKVPDERLATFVAKEQPQVGAFILSRVPLAKASAIMQKLDAAAAADLGRRLLTLRPISEDAMRLVAERLAQEFFGEEVEAVGEDRHAQLGAILNQLEGVQISQIITELEKNEPDEARRVREHIFSFEDIAAMPGEDRVRLLEEVQADRLVMALRGADQGFGQLILGALSPRSRRLVEAELSTPAKVMPSSVSEAQRAIAGLALSMSQRGMISLRPPQDAGAA